MPRHRQWKKSRAQALLFFLCLTFLSACSSTPRVSKTPLEYKLQSNQGPSLGDSISFLENRLKSRPRAFLEQAELAGLYLQRAKYANHVQQHNDVASAQDWIARSLSEAESPAGLLVQAKLHQMSHRFPEALAALDKALAQSPGNLGAQILKSRIALAQGDLELAVSTLESIKGSSGLGAVSLLKGQVAEAQGRFAEAREFYLQALKAESLSNSPTESARMRGIFARLEIRQGHYDSAREILDSAAKIPVELPLLELLRADCLFQDKKFKKAQEALSSAYTRFEDPSFLIRLAEYQTKSGETEEARKSLERAVSELRAHAFGHERDLALALFYLAPQENREEVQELMERELVRRQDPETLRIRDLVSNPQ